MTEENYNYRTSQILLRNKFHGDGEFKIPIIPKGDFHNDDFQALLLIGFDRINLVSNSHLDRMVHFFLYDYKFERVWEKPANDIDKLKRYRAVLSPDFSMYREMNPTMQLYNTFRNRWCGAYFASKGIRVIPTVSWGDENTFDFCFRGIPKGSVVAVSTYMVSEHSNRSAQKEFFLKGYREMLRQIEPTRIVCYNNPFPEMEGNIVFVDYELSSWKYQSKDHMTSEYTKYIGGRLPLPKDSDIIIKRGHVLSLQEEKGMGSAFGGEWKPKKPQDERFLGKPGEIKISYTKKGEMYETKIGDERRATWERHHTTHNREHTGHTNPHDHIIDWSNGFPHLEEPINYPDGNVPEFKFLGGREKMILFENRDELRFENISDFKWCMKCGGEVEFIWKGKSYSITHANGTINIGEGYYVDQNGIARNVESHEPCKEVEGLDAETADEILEYVIDGDKLRDIITQIEVVSRTI